VSGLETESYQSSAYDAITNTSTILSMAEKIPTSPIIYHSMNDSAATVAKLMTTYDLGTPAMAYEDAYQTDSNGQTAEFLVPAFVFPVTGDASTSAPQKNIVVPLIQDFEQQSDLSPAIPYNAAASGGTAASGTVASPPVMP
jgi:hypothetical protein